MSSSANTVPNPHEHDPIIERVQLLSTLGELFTRHEVAIWAQRDLGLIACIGGVATFPGNAEEACIRVNAVNFVRGGVPRAHVLLYGGYFGLARYMLQPSQNDLELLGQEHADSDSWYRAILDTATYSEEETRNAVEKVQTLPNTFQFSEPAS